MTRKKTESGKATMKTLSAVLNLSTATISKALRDSYEISNETKQRVFEAARQLNYVLNPHASSLRAQRSNTIAIVLPEIADSFFSLAINGIESVVEQKNYHSLIYLTHDSYEREAQMFGQLAGGRVDGILMSVAGNTEDAGHITRLQQTGMPIVFFDRFCEGIPGATVITNDYESAQTATCHLLEQGCKSISMITVNGHPSIFSARYGGYKKALNDYGIDTESVLNCHITPGRQNIDLIKQHIGSAKPDGLILTVEHLSTAAYTACNELGVSIPGQIKIVCFTNQVTAPILSPPLTTVQQPAFEMGKKAAELLFQHLSGKYIQLDAEHVVIPSQLVPRASTAATI